MAGLSNIAKASLLKHLFQNNDGVPVPSFNLTSIPVLYVALFKTLPDDDGAGGDEVVGGAYARQSAPNSVTQFNVSDGQMISILDIPFLTATADWGTVVGFGLYDAVSGGNFLFSASLSSSRTVVIGDQLKIASGALVVNII